LTHLQHRRGISGVFGLGAAPVLEFVVFSVIFNASRSQAAPR
jgi:hypothetical protein